MFNTMSHDFGTVAKGSKTEFRFQLKNVFEEDAHIVSVQSSCGCTKYQLTKSLLKTFETSEIVAEFNTRDYQGQRSATLTVKFDKPFTPDVQLRVTGFIRSDVVIQPGGVDFGAVDFGSVAEKKLLVTYAGRDDWRISDARSTEPYFEVELTEVSRGAGRIAYELLVRLTKDAPIGYIKDQLILVTNDPRSPELPVEMQGRVIPDITISPTKLFIGVVHPGQKVTKNLLIRGKKPFKIIDVKCPDKSFSIQPSKEAKSVHLLPVVFTAGDEPGRIAQKISLRTDQGKNAVEVFTAFAEVVKSDSASNHDPPAQRRSRTRSRPMRRDPNTRSHPRRPGIPWASLTLGHRIGRGSFRSRRRPRLFSAPRSARLRAPGRRRQRMSPAARSGFANRSSSHFYLVMLLIAAAKACRFDTSQARPGTLIRSCRRM